MSDAGHPSPLPPTRWALAIAVTAVAAPWMTPGGPVVVGLLFMGLPSIEDSLTGFLFAAVMLYVVAGVPTALGLLILALAYRHYRGRVTRRRVRLAAAGLGAVLTTVTALLAIGTDDLGGTAFLGASGACGGFCGAALFLRLLEGPARPRVTTLSGHTA